MPSDVVVQFLSGRCSPTATELDLGLALSNRQAWVSVVASLAVEVDDEARDDSGKKKTQVKMRGTGGAAGHHNMA
jgi:hypothetical protein